MKPVDRPVYIYALCEEWNLFSVRYVGMTVDLAKRYRQHLAPNELRRRTYKARWLNRLVASGKQPIMVELECVRPGGDWAEAERRWIRYFREVCPNLTNATAGGEGTLGFTYSDESRARMSESARRRGSRVGWTHSEETKTRISQMKRGTKLSEETRKKLSESHRHKRPTPETRAKRSRSLLLYWERKRLERAEQIA